jgi:hypothetical protein
MVPGRGEGKTVGMLSPGMIAMVRLDSIPLAVAKHHDRTMPIAQKTA